MKGLFATLFFSLFWIGLFAQTVTNVSVSQTGTRIIVSYDIDKASPEVRLTVSTDGGITFSPPLQKVSGDLKNVRPGHRSIVWDVLEERESLVGDDIVFSVEASEKPEPIIEWRYGFFDISYTKGTLALSNQEAINSNFGCSITCGTRFYLHRPIAKRIRFALDINWFDFGYSNLKEYPGHNMDLAMHAGLSLSINPTRKLSLVGYGHYVPTYSWLLLDKYSSFGGFEHIFCYGCNLSYGFFGVGFEKRNGLESKFRPTGFSPYEPSLFYATAEGWRFYITFKF